MGRVRVIMAGSYAALLMVILLLSILVWRRRHRERCIPLPEVPEEVRDRMSEAASLAADAAAGVVSLAARAATGAKSAAERATGALR